jgi:hypothetical protein
VSEQIVAEIELDMPGDDDDRLACEKREDPRNEGETHYQRSPLEKVGAGEGFRVDADFQLIDSKAKKQRLNNSEKVAADDGEDSEQQSSFVADEIWFQAQKRAHGYIKVKKSNSKMTNEK